MEENINELRSLFNSALVLLNSSDKDAINHDYFSLFNHDHLKINNYTFDYQAVQPEHYMEAIHLFSRILELKPGHVPSLFFRGAAKYRVDDYKGALDDYDNALEKGAGFPSLFINRGNMHYSLGHYGRAIDNYDRAIESDNTNVRAYYNRALAYAELNNLENAHRNYSRVIELNPENASAYSGRAHICFKKKHYHDAINDFTSAISLGQNLWELYFNRAACYVALNELPEAIEDYTNAIPHNRNNVETYLRRADLYIKQNKLKEALSDIDEAILIRPDNPQTLYERGLVLQKLIEYDKSIIDFTKGINLDSTNYLCLKARAESYATLGKYREAIEDFNVFITQNPNDFNALLGRGLAYSAFKDHLRAYLDFTCLYKLKPEDLYVKTLIENELSSIRAYDDKHSDYKQVESLLKMLDSGKNKETENSVIESDPIDAMIEVYETDLLSDPSKTELNFEIGFMYYSKNDFASAATWFSKVIHLGMEHTGYFREVDFARALRGICYGMRGLHDEALPDFSQSIKYHVSGFNRGVAFFKTKQYEKAADDFSYLMERIDSGQPFSGNRLIFKSDINKSFLNDFLFQILLYRGIVRFTLSDTAAARDDLKRLLLLVENDSVQYSPDDLARLYLLLGMFEIDLDNYNEGRQYKRKAEEITTLGENPFEMQYQSNSKYLFSSS